MAVLNTGLAKTSAEAYTIDNSCRFNYADDAYLGWTPGSTSNRRTWIWSGWIKRSKLSFANGAVFIADGDGSGHGTYFRFESNNTFQFLDYDSGYNFNLLSNTVYRDTTAWMHLVLAVDTTQATDSDRIKIYFNGEQVTDFASTAYPTQNYDTYVNHTVAHGLNHSWWNGSINAYGDGYLAEVHFIDGMSFFSDTSGTANSSFNINTFGETGDYGEWKPVEVTGVTYGTNGFYLDFSDSAALGDDAAGSNDFTVTNLAAADQMLDTPTNNFATMNPLAALDSGTTLSEGNLKATQANLGAIPATMAVTSGKWYWEVRCEQVGSNHLGIGVVDIDNFDCENYVGSDTYGWNIHALSGKKYHNASTVGSNVGSFANGDVMGVAVDVDNDDIWFSENGTWTEGDPAAGTGASHTNLSGTICPAIGSASSSTRWVCNFGQEGTFNGNETAGGNADENGYGDFLNSVPSGFLALCTANLDTPAVIPSEHFDIVTYTGNDSDNEIDGLNFQPDWVWIKRRDDTDHHMLFDSLRGFNDDGDSLHIKISEDSNQESHDDDQHLKSFDSDGFTVQGSDSETNGDTNTYVAWNWKIAGTASGTTTGSGTSKAYSARHNTDAGISLIKYIGNGTAGHTIPHHLGAAPDVVWVCKRTVASNVLEQRAILGNANLQPTTDEATSYSVTWFNGTAPSSTVFTLGSGSTNVDDVDHFAWCFRSIDGYSKMGKYTGNGSSNGTFVYTGFRVKWLLHKKTNDTANWVITDATRNTYNPVGLYLIPNENNAEADGTTFFDFTSNGFKLRTSGGGQNGNDDTHVFIAFAETPFRYANAR